MNVYLPCDPGILDPSIYSSEMKTSIYKKDLFKNVHNIILNGEGLNAFLFVRSGTRQVCLLLPLLSILYGKFVVNKKKKSKKKK